MKLSAIIGEVTHFPDDNIRRFAITIPSGTTAVGGTGVGATESFS